MPFTRTVQGIEPYFLAFVLAAPGQDARPVPPPVPQRTANCVETIDASDAHVCADDQLRSSDARLAGLYEAAGRARLADGGRYIESGEDWFRRRSLCAFQADHRACIMAAYRERSAVIAALLASRSGRRPPLTASCGREAWGARWIRGGTDVAVLVLIDARERPLAAAIAEPLDRSWTAYLSARRNGRQLALTRSDDRLDCRLSTRLEGLSDASLRDRADAIDRRLAAARDSYDGDRLDLVAYEARLQGLRAEEEVVHAEAELRAFDDPVTDAHWHRGRLKFPTATELELARVQTLRHP